MEGDHQKQTVLKLRIDQSWRPGTEMELYLLLGELLVYLDDPVTQDGLRAIAARKPRQVICLDAAFRHNDELKTNTVLEMKAADIVFHTI